MYIKLGRKCVAPECKNCLITGDGTYFSVFPKFLNGNTVVSNSYITFAIKI